MIACVVYVARALTAQRDANVAPCRGRRGANSSSVRTLSHVHSDAETQEEIRTGPVPKLVRAPQLLAPAVPASASSAGLAAAGRRGAVKRPAA